MRAATSATYDNCASFAIVTICAFDANCELASRLPPGFYLGVFVVAIRSYRTGRCDIEAASGGWRSFIMSPIGRVVRIADFGVY